MSPTLLFRDYPVGVWLFGVLFLAVAWVPEMGWAFGLVGFGFIAVPSILTVRIDRAHDLLDVRHRSLFRGVTRSYAVGDILDVMVVEDSEKERMYRVELLLTTGERVPLRGYFSVGRRAKERQAAAMRSAIASR